MQRYTLNNVKDALKSTDAWWTIAVIDPIATRFTLLIANYTRFTPNFISFLSFIFAILTIISFAGKNWITAGFLYEISFLFDCIDGKLARLRGTTSSFGKHLEEIVDWIRYSGSLIALNIGLYQSGYTKAWILGMVYLSIYHWRKYHFLERSMEEKFKVWRTKANFLQRHRLNPNPFNLVNQEALLFFIFPLLGKPYWGLRIVLAIAIIDWILHRYMRIKESSKGTLNSEQ